MLKTLPKVWVQVNGAIVLHDLYTFNMETARRWADDGLDVVEYEPKQRVPRSPMSTSK
jgi:hypothetical protein